MKVYFISTNWGRGGAGGVAQSLYESLCECGHECRFAYGRFDHPANINGFKFTYTWDTYLHAGLSRIFDNSGFASWLSTKRLIRDIQKFNPDIITLHNPLGYVLHLGMLMNFIRKSGIKATWTLQDAWSVTGHCITGLCDHLDQGCGHCPRKKEYPQSYVIDGSKRNLKRKASVMNPVMPNLSLVTPSQWMEGLARKSYLKDYPIYVIPNGINLSRFSPLKSDLREKYGLTNKKVLLAVASIWAPFKGFKYLKQLESLLDESYQLVVIGAGLTEEDKQDSNILFIDRTQDVTELAKWYSTADCFVNPTMGDNFPTVNLEALACGTPVVTFRTGGSGESVGSCGFVVEQGNVQALKDAIIECQNFIQEKKITKEMCIERVQLYSQKAQNDAYLKLFEE